MLKTIESHRPAAINGQRKNTLSESIALNIGTCKHRKSGKVTLLDCLTFIEQRATQAQLRAVQIAAFGRCIGAPPVPRNTAMSSITRFILTATRMELQQIESVIAERRNGLCTK